MGCEVFEASVKQKVALQRELLVEIAPELIGELDSLERLLESVRKAVLASQKDVDDTRPYYSSTKYVQGRVDGGDSALRRIREALNGEQ